MLELLTLKKRQHAKVHLECRNADGELLWVEDLTENTWHDEGEMALLSAYLATTMSGYGAPPSSVYFGLDARGSVAEGDTLTSLSGEPSGNGYARQGASTAGTGVGGQDWVLASPGGTATSKTVTFSCSGSAWSAVTKLFLCTVSSGTAGKLLCTLALSTSRTLNPGDSLNASMVITLSE